MIFDLPPPNDGMHSLDNIIFGRSDYESIRYHPNDPANALYWENDGNGNSRLKRNWRMLLTPPDPYAGVPIYLDPTMEWCVQPHLRIMMYELYQPQLLEDMLCKYPPVIQAIKDVRQSGYDTSEFRKLNNLIMRFFRTDYRQAYEFQVAKDRETYPGWAEHHRRVYLPVEPEQHWKKACKFLDLSVHLIGMFLVRHFELYPELWVETLLYTDSGQEFWKMFTGQLRPVARILKKDRSVSHELPDSARRSSGPDDQTSS